CEPKPFCSSSVDRVRGKLDCRPYRGGGEGNPKRLVVAASPAFSTRSIFLTIRGLCDTPQCCTNCCTNPPPERPGTPINPLHSPIFHNNIHKAGSIRNRQVIGSSPIVGSIFSIVHRQSVLRRRCKRPPSASAFL